MTTLAPIQYAHHGGGFRAYRLHGATPALLDPFMGVDHAWMSEPTFPPHPHAGFSAVTYLFPDAETAIANRDSRGNSNLIEPGGLHWTAAGRGVVHQEDPAVPGQTTHLLQIFVNLPRARQLDAPFALTLAPQDVPVVQQPGVEVRVPLGSFGGVHSPLTPPTPVNLLDITLAAGAELVVPVPAGQRAFFLPVAGQAELDGQSFGLDTRLAPVLRPAEVGQQHRLRASKGPCQIAVFMGEPLNQPMFSNGPMAFASQADLIAATTAYHRGDMGRL